MNQVQVSDEESEASTWEGGAEPPRVEDVAWWSVKGGVKLGHVAEQECTSRW